MTGILVFVGIWIFMELLYRRGIGFGVLWPKELKDASDTKDV